MKRVLPTAFTKIFFSITALKKSNLTPQFFKFRLSECCIVTTEKPVYAYLKYFLFIKQNDNLFLQQIISLFLVILLWFLNTFFTVEGFVFIFSQPNCNCLWNEFIENNIDAIYICNFMLIENYRLYIASGR